MNNKDIKIKSSNPLKPSTVYAVLNDMEKAYIDDKKKEVVLSNEEEFRLMVMPSFHSMERKRKIN